MLVSFSLLLVAGFFFGIVMGKLKLPPLLGMLFVGVILGPYVLDLLHQDLLHISPEIRVFSLIVILIRAGLGIRLKDLKQVGFIALKMSSIPCLFEGFMVMGLSYYLLGFSLAEAGMLGFIIAAVSPAVVVPSMLELKEARYGEDKQIPTLLLAGTSIDDVFAITLFTFFLSLGTAGDANVAFALLQIPFGIVLGILGGAVLGYVLIKIFDSKLLFENATEKLLLVLTASILYHHFGEDIGLASLLGVMTLGFVLLEKREKLAIVLGEKLRGLWIFAQILLFSLVGAAVNIEVAIEAGLIGLLIILIGLLARGMGVMVATFKSNLNMKERLFCLISYTPKATVQAAIGGIPLVSGVAMGGEILAIAVLSILVTAPLGAILIKKTAPYLLTQSKEAATD